MPSPTLGFVTTDLMPDDTFAIRDTLVPDFLKIDSTLGLAASAFNLLVNPGFEIDQRAAGPYTGNGIMTLDRWETAYVGAVTGLIVAQDLAVHFGPSLASAMCTFTKGAGTRATLGQNIEDWQQARNNGTVSFRMRVKCATAGAVRIGVQDGSVTTWSGFHSGGGEWEVLAVTHVMSGMSATACKPVAAFEQDCTAWLDNATLVIGDVPLGYSGLQRGVETGRCERYYEVHRAQAGAADYPYFSGYAGAGGELLLWSVPWHVAKATAGPLATVGGTWTHTNTVESAPVVHGANAVGYTLRVTSAAAGRVSIAGDASAGAGRGYVVGESNP